MTKKIAVLINPTSGKGRGGREAIELALQLRSHGIDSNFLVGTTADEALELTRRAVADGVDAVIAAGGDGTVNLALQAIVGTGTPLAIAPLGTGNDNAAALGIPKGDLASVADAVAEQRVRTIDAGRVTTADGSQRWFMGVLSSGFDSCVNETANKMTWPKGEARYFLGIVKELRTFKPLPYRVTIDGKEINEAGMLVAVGNGISYGGGMKVCEGAKLDDGLFTVTWLHDVKKIDFLRVFPRVYKGTHITHPSVTQYTGRTITLDAPDQIVYADGERIGPLPAEVTMHPGVLKVIVPPDSP